jgi:hypothetical protein
VVFQKAIERAVPAEDVSTRVVNLIDCITYSVFMYTSRGLFERDKLIFSSQMAFQASCFTLKHSNTFTYHSLIFTFAYSKYPIVIQLC